MVILLVFKTPATSVVYGTTLMIEQHISARGLHQDDSDKPATCEGLLCFYM